MKRENKIALWLILLAIPAGMLIGVIDHSIRTAEAEQTLNKWLN